MMLSAGTDVVVSNAVGIVETTLLLVVGWGRVPQMVVPPLPLLPYDFLLYSSFLLHSFDILLHLAYRAAKAFGANGFGWAQCLSAPRNGDKGEYLLIVFEIGLILEHLSGWADLLSGKIESHARTHAVTTTMAPFEKTMKKTSSGVVAPSGNSTSANTNTNTNNATDTAGPAPTNAPSPFPAPRTWTRVAASADKAKVRTLYAKARLAVASAEAGKKKADKLAKKAGKTVAPPAAAPATAAAAPATAAAAAAAAPVAAATTAAAAAAPATPPPSAGTLRPYTFLIQTKCCLTYCT
ncbi:hypothetical protein PG991_014382 [Apiospora marii]|uniref:Uncharacterized protein n=2 Tax=Apiospora marii TaxID=335849 RepID=A0ABR1R9M8_9PEZI